MDDLTLIRSFGSSEPAASAAERERVRAALLTHIERAARPRFGRRRWVVAFAAAALLLGAGAALGLGPLRDLFVGEPAPPSVKREIARNNILPKLLRENPELAIYGMDGPVVRAEQATALMKFRVAQRWVRLWTAPLVSGGGSCAFLQLGRSLGAGPCTAPVNLQPPVLYQLMRAGERGAGDFGLIVGHATADVARVELRLGSGRERRVRLVNGFFAVDFSLGHQLDAREEREEHALIRHQDREARQSKHPESLQAHQRSEWEALERRQAARRAELRPVELSALDATGGHIATISLPERLPEGPAFVDLRSYTRMRALLQINTPRGVPATLIVREVAGRDCDSVHFMGGGGVGCTDRGGHRGFGFSYTGSTGFDGSLLMGYAGRDATDVEIVFRDGHRQRLAVLEGRFLGYFGRSELYGARAVARGAGGEALREKRLCDLWGNHPPPRNPPPPPSACAPPVSR